MKSLFLKRNSEPKYVLDWWFNHIQVTLKFSNLERNTSKTQKN